MRKRLKPLCGFVGLALACAAAAIPVPTATAQPGGGPPPTEATGKARAATSVTLITGDTVQLQSQPGGRYAASFVPASGREKVTFQQLEVDGDLYVYPADVLPYVGSDQLDTGLFNITELIEQGYDNANRTTIPLILRYGAAVKAGGAESAGVEAVSNGPVLDSINARAVKADKKNAQRFWESIDDDRARATAPRPRLDDGIVEVRLDRKVKSHLHQSVAQIGAPQAWAAGFDGTGVKVAVLDTGIDLGHPDLSGKVVESRSFVPGEEVGDGYGHGTHVAATIAGTGAASDKRRQGVAHGADLVIGKVLSNAGSGEESWIIDGMEWAAATGVKVVNMSLGGAPTDGSDTMSLALNAISRDTGVLFVVSAGNSGPGPQSVGSPGAADAALTVAAVDRDESIADFSSRGPRFGDLGLKPDISGPGVGIVAARAAGTSMGGVVDEHYTSASGTSMAAPHVAGAAAILAQQHPGWTGAQLKDALVSTARRNEALRLWDQGGGRVDVARAVGQGVHGTGTLDLGTYEVKPTDVLHKEITYTNSTTKTIRLDLAMKLTGRDGRTTLPAGAVNLGRTTVEAAAGTTVTVPITIRPDQIPPGHYSGYVEGTGPGGTTVHTTVAVQKNPPKHKVTLKNIGHDGGPANTLGTFVFGEDLRYDFIGQVFGGQVELELPEGEHYMVSLMELVNQSREQHTVVHPTVMIDGPKEITFDARTSREVVVNTPLPAVQRGEWSYHFRREFKGRRIANYARHFEGVRKLHVNPTQKVTDGYFEFGTRFSLIAPPLTTTVSRPRNGGGSVELMYHAQSPAFDGTKRLPVVDVGKGQPADYAGRDVRGKIALVSDVETGMEPEHTARAAAAGAAMAAMIAPQGYEIYSRLDLSRDDRLPTMATVLTYDEGRKLHALLARGTVELALKGVSVSPYLYDLMPYFEGGIPADPVITVSQNNTATVTADYREPGGEQWSKEQRFGWRPWQQAAINQQQRIVRTPSIRTEFISTGNTLWQQRVQHFRSFDDFSALAGGMTHLPMTYRAGQRATETWWAPVVRPNVPPGMSHLQSYREDDMLHLRVPEFVDSSPTHYGYAEGDITGVPDAGQMRLYRDGELLTSGEWAWGDFSAGGASGNYRLDLEIVRQSPEWSFSPRTMTSWTFDSSRSTGRSLLPLLQVDYDIATDGRNRARANRATTIDLTVRHQDGVQGLEPTGLRLWTTHDDGLTWTEARKVTASGNGAYKVSVNHPPLRKSNGFIGLRVQATDSAGNTVTQTVNRAYGLR